MCLGCGGGKYGRAGKLNGFSKANFYVAMIGGALTVLVIIVSAIFWVSMIAQETGANASATKALELRMGALEGEFRSDHRCCTVAKMDRDQREIETHPVPATSWET